MIELLLVALLISSTNQFQCASHKNFYFSMISFDVKNLTDALTSISETIQDCRIEITRNYTAYTLEIVFNSTNLTIGETFVRSPRLSTKFALNPSVSTLVSVLSFTCLMGHECSRDFVFNQSRWLLQQNYSEMLWKFREILIKDNKKVTHCVNYPSSQSLASCPQNRGCSLTLTDATNTQKPVYTGGCATKGKTSTMIRINTFNSQKNVTNSILFTCMFDECNSIAISSNITDIVERLYNGFHLISSLKIATEMLSTTTIIGSSNTSQVHSTSETLSTKLSSQSTVTSPRTFISSIPELVTVIDNIEQTPNKTNNATSFNYAKYLSFLLVYLLMCNG